MTNDDVIDRISDTMIPVVLDYQKVLNRRSREARFLRPLMKESGDLQGVWIFSPEGNVLGRGVSFGNQTAKTVRLIDDAMRAFPPVEPRQFKRVSHNPHRGKGFRPDGSVRLAEYVRRRDKHYLSSPVIASVGLSGEEFQSFAPRTIARKTE